MFGILTRGHIIRLVLSLAILTAALTTTMPAEASWHSLTGLLPAYVDRVDYKISPDSRTVVFVADKDTDNVQELYAVPITGTTPIKLNPPFVANGGIERYRFSFTPDSQYVIYLADQEVDNRVEMYRVPVGGGPALKLNPPLVAGGNVFDFKIDPASGRVVYVADQQTNEVFELWSITGTGAGMVKLNGSLVSGGDIGTFDIDRLSGRAVYSADQETDGKFELYSVPLTGGSVTKLNPPIVLTGGGDDGLCCQWAIDPVVPVVVFIAREAGSTGGRVYSIFTAGGVAPTQLSFGLLVDQRILSFRISPAGDRVVFDVGTRIGSTNAFKGNLYSNLIGAGGAADVTEHADPLYGTDTYDILPDGSRVAYRFQNNAATTDRLESATLLGVRTPLYVPGVSDPILSFFRFSADSQWVMYQTGVNYLQRGLYTIPPGGGTPTNFGAAEFALMLPNSSRILYLRATDTDNHSDLLSSQIFGGDERNLSRLIPAAYAGDAKASPNNQWIVFSVQIGGQYELRVSDGAPALPPNFIPMLGR